MAKGPEPKDRSTGGTPSFSVDDQLKAFRAKLDGSTRETRIIPGFLFRNGRDQAFPLSIEDGELNLGNLMWCSRDKRANIARQTKQANYLITHVDDTLLKQHVATFRTGLEIRDLLSERVRPVEVLEMVRDVWGKGKIIQGDAGATLSYSYPYVTEEWKTFTNTEHRYDPINGDPTYTTTHVGKTGKWFALTREIKEEVAVDFGNAKYPSPESLLTSEIDEFFADRYESPRPNGEYIFPITLFQGIPTTIWRRPDNLGIRVTVPYALLLKKYGNGTYHRELVRRLRPSATPAPSHLGFFAQVSWEYSNYNEEWESVENMSEDNIPNTSPAYLGAGKSTTPALLWLDQSTSQQEIMDFLSQRLETQRANSQLPSQMRELELAKIDELRKRGLFKE